MLFLEDLKKKLESGYTFRHYLDFTIYGCSVQSVNETSSCFSIVTFEDKDDNVSFDFDLEKKVFLSYGCDIEERYNSILNALKEAKETNSLLKVCFRIRREKPYIIHLEVINQVK